VGGGGEMVDPFTGDFSYNIHLLDIDGYPLTLNYQAGISMEQEASWVGLGWSLNPGSITRQMRGLPDEFDGDEIQYEHSFKEQTRVGGGPTFSVEVFGSKGLGLGGSARASVYSDSQRGLGLAVGLGANLSLSATVKDQDNKAAGVIGIQTGLGITLDTQEEGVNIDGSIGVSGEIGRSLLGALTGSRDGFGIGVNSRNGLQYANLNPFINTIFGTTPAGILLPTGSPTHVPQLMFPTKTSYVNLSAAAGGEIGPVFISGGVNGYKSKTEIKYPRRSVKGYGYFNVQNATEDEESLLDINREKDGSVIKETPLLSVPSFTHDLYQVSGQGYSGTFRPYRSEIGTLYDPKVKSSGTSIDLGGEAGIGGGVQFGADLNFSNTFSETGPWVGPQNRAALTYSFRSLGEAQAANYEPFYFKSYAEPTVLNPQDPFLRAQGGLNYSSNKIKLTSGGFSASIGTERYMAGADATAPTYRTNRERRNETLTWLKAQDATFALEKELSVYQPNAFAIGTNGNIQRSVTWDRKSFNGRKPHHITEYTATRTDGTRYVYGLPAYNVTQREVAFSVSRGRTPDSTGGRVWYSKEEASTGNRSGKDHFFYSTTTPGYAYAYLLTAVLSNDYQDLTGDGPTEDDLGNYTKFNYSKIDSNQAWRMPFYRATFMEGNLSDPDDNRGTYLYGVKEQWYVHSIESRNHVAVFMISERVDGRGASGEYPISPSLGTHSYKLDKILLYAKKDIQKSGIQSAIPLKTVHFEYDYSLCRGIPNTNENGGGKLTLKRLWFTYDKSEKGRANRYAFQYEGLNPDYTPLAIDRWTSYKPLNLVSGGLLPNDFPYVDQDWARQVEAGTNKRWADVYTSAWCLTRIELPSGGTLKVDYEADTYGYVQDKAAMQMIRIEGVSTNPDYPWEHRGELYSAGRANRNYLVFKIDDDLRQYFQQNSQLGIEEKNEILRKAYLRDIRDLYFHFRMMLGHIPGAASNEDVTGYAQVNSFNVIGICPSNEDYAYLHVKPVPIKDKEAGRGEVQPMARAGWNYAYLHNPKAVFPTQFNDGDVIGLIANIANKIPDVLDLFKDRNRVFHRKGFSRIFNPAASWIRLYSPLGTKYGGGCRVKKIEVVDNWDSMTGSQVPADKATYGQEFFYDMEIPDPFATSGQKTLKVSSGVALYEPMVGNEENPWRQPIAQKDIYKLVPDQGHYKETPVGESFFPSAQVGYSQVRTRTLRPADKPDFYSHGDGYTITEFYTAKDFPTQWAYTDLEKTPDGNKSIQRKPNGVESTHRVAMSQGFYVELNDMHGKMRAQTEYSNAGKQLSKVSYHYKTGTGQRAGQLENLVTVIDPLGNASQALLGVDVEVYHDKRYSHSELLSGSYPVNAGAFPVVIIVVAWGTILSSGSKVVTDAGFYTTTKVVRRMGILERVEATQEASTVVTRNQAYDSETGAVLLTSVQNEFDDEIYSFTMPAHWAYNGMGQAYKSQGVEATLAGSVTNGFIDKDDLWPGKDVQLNQIFTEGDELGFTAGELYRRAWVVDVVAATNSIKLVDEAGHPFFFPISGSARLQVLRSGRRNMAGAPVATFSTLNVNPLQGGRLNLDPNQVLNASAVEYTDRWPVDCCTDWNTLHGKVYPDDRLAPVGNPYYRGLRGNWRQVYTHTFLDQRVSSNQDIQRDGVFVDYQPFWKYQRVNHTSIAPTGSEKWIQNSEVTRVNLHGAEIENRDALGRYSSAVYGFNNTLPVAVATNAAHRQLGVEGFEDVFQADRYFKVKRGSCPIRRQLSLPLSIANSTPLFALDDHAAHTGRYSLGVVQHAPGVRFEIPYSSRDYVPRVIAGTESDIQSSFSECPDCNGQFAVRPGEKYVISVWALTTTSGNFEGNVFFPNSSRLIVDIRDAGNSVRVLDTFHPTGNPIDGWQRIEGVVEIPMDFSVNDKVGITLGCIPVAGMNSGGTFFDDFRIAPYDAEVKTYVYDPHTLRLLAELDNRNYATFFDYDEEGMLVRIRRETEEGIYTVQESRTNLSKK
jgi:hypothetical protein